MDLSDCVRNTLIREATDNCRLSSDLPVPGRPNEATFCLVMRLVSRLSITSDLSRNDPFRGTKALEIGKQSVVRLIDEG